MSSFHLPLSTAHLSQVLSRTYAQAVAGVTKQMYYNNGTHEFTLSYEVQDNVSSQVTEVCVCVCVCACVRACVCVCVCVYVYMCA